MIAKKYYFIGDIHGCSDELEALFLKIDLGINDQVICVGDLVNKGPNSEKVVQLLIKNNALSVMGNHDLIIKYVDEERKEGIKPPFELKKTHYDLYNSLSKSSIDYILSLPLFIEIPEINTLVVHAGIMPNLALEKHSDFEITSLRILDPIHKTYIKRDYVGYPWYFYYSGDKQVIYGHNAARSIKINKNTVGIDTGCLYGARLTAYILPDRRFIHVDAKKAYVDYSQGGKYEMPR
jgi:diadenosine tetraphosphatase ApaH/serine/threonine PP2A family protein phosphatase